MPFNVIKIITFSLLLSYTTLHAVDLHGRIIDVDNRPIAEAHITLSDTTFSATSQNDGRFSISSDNIDRPLHAVHSNQYDYTIRNNTLFLRLLTAKASLEIDLFTVHGRVTGISYAGTFRRGTHTFALSHQHGSGIYILRLSIDNEVYYEQLCRNSDQSFMGGIDFEHTKNHSTDAKAAKSTAAMDTLIISKSGYQSVKLVLHSYVGDVSPVVLPDSSGYPKAILMQNGLKAEVYLTDTARGYYRASRFDWSGMIGRVTYRNHSWYDDWKTPHDPTSGEHGIGPCEEFDMENPPPGYAEASPGEEFVKIGVGLLQKTDNNTYKSYLRQDQITDYGTRRMGRGTNWIEFHHTIPPVRGIEYTYVKRISCIPNAPGIKIERTLYNTGTVEINTVHYCHNFTIIDGNKIGPAYSVSFRSAPQPGGDVSGELTVHDTIIGFTSSPSSSNAFYYLLNGLTDSVYNHYARICNTTTNACVRFEGTTAITKCALYAQPTALCIEPFSSISVSASKKKTWKSTYYFSVQ